MNKQGVALVGSGKKTALTSEEERQLAKCIEELCSLGFSPTRGQVIDLVKDYVTLRKLNTPFKENRPGKEWLRKCLRRNSLSTKKANMISAARMATTSNPFVMYDFFDTVQKIIEANNFTASQIWNCDETGFPTDAGQCKVIAPRGKQPNKRTSGAGRENISVLATCSASGKALDSFIIFSAVNFQSTWRGRNPLPNACYGISKNGWMTTEIFASWFQNGHLTHVSLELIEKAIEEKITIVKLPPHVTDRLQSLDVCCFDALKREWENKLNERMNLLGPRETISKSVLVDALSNIWHKSLSEKKYCVRF